MILKTQISSQIGVVIKNSNDILFLCFKQKKVLIRSKYFLFRVNQML